MVIKFTQRSTKGIYDAHQEIAKDDSFFPKVVDSDGKGIEVGAVMIDNRTGAIVSFVGGRYSVEREELNRATQGGRPNGSTMKPIVAYAPAMEMGVVQPGMIIPDTEYYYRYEPEKEVTNWDNDHKGLLTVRESLALSRNVPAVKSLTLIPHDYAKQKIHSMGIKENVYDASALGPSNITVEANTAAYATFANGGTFVETYMIE
ncbi:MAG: penicillin-binding protein, partial [Bacillaceae bacterium]|nr:penicillin-binding protein [Bacillaceae bacterium]